VSSYVAVTPKLRSLNLSMCFTALLLRVPEVFGCYMLYQSVLGQVSMRLATQGHTNLRCQGQSSG